jgi:hypothetical protein
MTAFIARWGILFRDGKTGWSAGNNKTVTGNCRIGGMRRSNVGKALPLHPIGLVRPVIHGRMGRALMPGGTARPCRAGKSVGATNQ